MKIRGESEFSVKTALDVADILTVARGAMEDLRRQHDAVLSAEVSTGASGDFQIEIVVRVANYAEAERLMAKVASDIAERLGSTESMTIAGATELVPA